MALKFDSPRYAETSENGVRLAQKMQVGPCISVGTQLLRAAVGPTSGPTWRLSHSVHTRRRWVDKGNLFWCHDVKLV